MSQRPITRGPQFPVERDTRGDWLKIIGAIVGFTLIGVLAGVINTAREGEQTRIVQVAPTVIATPPSKVVTNANPSP